MGRQGQSDKDAIDVVEVSRMHGRARGDWEPLAVIERDGDYRLLFDSKTSEATEDVADTEMRVRVFGEDQEGNLLEIGGETLSDTISNNENGLVTYLARALDSVSNDEVRTIQLGTDTNGSPEKIIAEQLDTAVNATDVGQLTYAARALNSSGLDEFVTRVTDSAGNQIDPLNQDILESVGNDEARTRLFGPDDGGALQQAQVEALNNSPAAGTYAQVTYLARALNSQDLDEFITRVTDSGGAQIDPLNQDALDSVANDELRSLLMGTDTGGADQKLIAEQLDTAVANTDVALLTWLARALNSVGVDELVARTTDSSGNQQDLQQTASAYENGTALAANSEVASTLVAPGGSNIHGKVESSGQYSVEARYQDDQGNTIFTETIANAVAGGTVTNIGPNSNAVAPASDHVVIAVTDGSGADQTVNKVLHYN
jgi:hypothetical protein